MQLSLNIVTEEGTLWFDFKRDYDASFVVISFFFKALLDVILNVRSEEWSLISLDPRGV
ncbi:hypothetical protein C1H46_039871 [Malus baccata]|uniref:Uncharacterized protein n=1 Tax=Malus baccata TaxID=106549 RepID=A0A540KK87_MALBA|nr:hypothetical protein C1H46_039871 [Malus baccata]